MIPAGIRRLFRLDRVKDVERAVDDELRFHLDMMAQELVAQGWDPAGARREAERRFGDVRGVRARLAAMDKGRVRRRDRAEWWGGVLRDARYTLRGLARAPGFTAGVVLTLGLGIGANATMFGIVDRLLFRPPAYLADPGRVHRAWFIRNDPPFPGTNTSYARYQDVRELTRSFDVVAAFIEPSLAVGTGSDAAEMHVLGVSGSYWQLFDMRPAAGRFFTDAENALPTGTPVAVLGWDFWRDRFGGRGDAVGRTLRIGQRDYTIIGVAPRGFMGTSMGAAVAIIPIAAAVAETGAAPAMLRTYGWQWPEVFVHRKPGVSAAAADADLTNAYQASYRRQLIEMPRSAPFDKARPHAVAASVLKDRGPGGSPTAKVALWLVAVAAIVLLITCANVGNLLLARAFGRRREIAVRLALGIGRGRLLAQLLTESLLLAVLGGVAGIAIAQWGGGVLRASLLPDVDWTSTLADSRVLLFGAVAAVAAGLLAGLAPALYALRNDVAGSLKSGMHDVAFHRSRSRVTLLVVQGALSVVLLVGAGLFVRSFARVRAIPLGFDAERLIWVNPVMRGVQLTPGDSVALRERLAAAALTAPGVESSARGLSVPFYTTWNFDLATPGVDSALIHRLGPIELQATGPGFFATLGTRIVRGRGLAESDAAGAPLVIVVSRELARALWRDQDPIGRCVQLQVGTTFGPCRTVVGVAEGTKTQDFDEAQDPRLNYYIPLAQWRPGYGGVYVRVRGDAAAALPGVVAAMQRVMPGAAYVTARPVADIVAPNMAQWKLGVTMFSIFGALALVVAIVGLYAVIAYGVAQRTHELGVRMALGARVADVIRLVVGEGLRVTALSVALGLLAAAFAARWIAPLLFATSPRDPAIFGAVPAVLLLVAALASLLPALRAARVDPNTALRDE